MDNRKILFVTVIVAALVLAVAVIAEMTDDQCWKLATNIDKAVQNALGPDPEFIVEEAKENPCTGEEEMSKKYVNRLDGPLFARTEWLNGAVDGKTTKVFYQKCPWDDRDGTAKVENWSLHHLASNICDNILPGFPLPSLCRGLQHNPVIDFPNLIMEKCNTIN